MTAHSDLNPLGMLAFLAIVAGLVLGAVIWFVWPFIWWSFGQ